jgi:hypothetical protein
MVTTYSWIGGSRMPALLCLGSALLPFLTVQLSYLLAAQAGSVPWCIPYIDSCTSISATGRSGPASYLFRAGMLPSSTLIAGFWWLHWRWLRELRGGQPSLRGRAMLTLGLLACAGLVMYVSVLGEIGDLWRLQRRIGTVLFFAFTFLAQLLLAAEMHALLELANPAAVRTGRWLLRVCLLMLCIGVYSIIIQAIDESWHDAIEDAVEWLLALLLQLNFLLCTAVWWRSEWELGIRHRPKS